MKFTTLLGVSVLTAIVSAQSQQASPTSILTVAPHCASAAPDVIVTRSGVPVPACSEASNATKPSIVTMPGYGTNMTGTGTATASAPTSEFTGAASEMRAGVLVFGGLVAALMV